MVCRDFRAVLSHQPFVQGRLAVEGLTLEEHSVHRLLHRQNIDWLLIVFPIESSFYPAYVWNPARDLSKFCKKITNIANLALGKTRLWFFWQFYVTLNKLTNTVDKYYCFKFGWLLVCIIFYKFIRGVVHVKNSFTTYCVYLLRQEFYLCHNLTAS